MNEILSVEGDQEHDQILRISLSNIGLCAGMIGWTIGRHAGVGLERSNPTEF